MEQKPMADGNRTAASAVGGRTAGAADNTWLREGNGAVEGRDS